MTQVMVKVTIAMSLQENYLRDGKRMLIRIIHEQMVDSQGIIIFD